MLLKSKHKKSVKDLGMGLCALEVKRPIRG